MQRRIALAVTAAVVLTLLVPAVSQAGPLIPRQPDMGCVVKAAQPFRINFMFAPAKRDVVSEGELRCAGRLTSVELTVCVQYAPNLQAQQAGRWTNVACSKSGRSRASNHTWIIHYTAKASAANGHYRTRAHFIGVTSAGRAYAGSNNSTSVYVF